MITESKRVIESQTSLDDMIRVGGGAQESRNGATFYGIAQKKTEINYLYSNSYASCIGLAIYRPSNKTGLLAHFWATISNAADNFIQDMEDLIRIWGEVQTNDHVTIWVGKSPNRITQCRLKTDWKAILQKKGFIEINPKPANKILKTDTGEVYLNLQDGILSTKKYCLSKLKEISIDQIPKSGDI